MMLTHPHLPRIEFDFFNLRNLSSILYDNMLLCFSYAILVSKLTDYFTKNSTDGLSEFNLPVNRLVVKQT